MFRYTMSSVIVALVLAVSAILHVAQHLRIGRLRRTNAELADLAAANWAASTPDPFAAIEMSGKPFTSERR
jgi:hypothetical protein